MRNSSVNFLAKKSYSLLRYLQSTAGGYFFAAPCMSDWSKQKFLLSAVYHLSVWYVCSVQQSVAADAGGDAMDSDDAASEDTQPAG